MTKLFNTTTRIALNILGLLKQEGNLNSAQLSMRIGHKAAYVQQVAYRLKRNKLIISLKGPGGGYVLRARPITLIEVLEACGQLVDTNMLPRTPSDVLEERVADNFAEMLL